MALRTITAPGVQINEIDKSGYTTVPTGTAVYLKGFTSKGEAYKPMEITTRSAYEQIYGVPDTEAERYTYAAACETLNQGGRLWMARLPYDNDSFEKIVGIKYKVETKKQISSSTELSDYVAVQDADKEIVDAAVIKSTETPVLYDLSQIEAFRTDEDRVPADSFLIVDTTFGSYNRVVEDDRKGEKRELIGIVPVVTTAANGLLAQSMINVDLSSIRNYETLKHDFAKCLNFNDLSNMTLKASDVAVPFNTECDLSVTTSTSQLSIAPVEINQETSWTLDTLPTRAEAVEALKHIVANDSYKDKIEATYNNYISNTMDFIESTLKIVQIGDDSPVVVGDIETLGDIKDCTDKLISYYGYVDLSTTSIQEIANAVYTIANDHGDVVVDDLHLGPMGETIIDETTIGDIEDELKELLSGLTTTFAWQVSIKFDLSVIPYYKSTTVPKTQSLDANDFFPTIQPSVDGEGLDPEHLKDIGVVVFKMFLDPAEGNKVSYVPVEAYAGSLCKDDKDPNTGVTKFIDTIINSQSKYINFFSNCFTKTASKKFYIDDCDILIAPPANAACLGFYSRMTTKDISISKSILDGMDKCFDKVSDINKLDIDIVPDAGLANIASYIKAIFGDKGPYDLTITDDLGNSMLGMWKCEKATDAHVKMWKTIEMKHDNFCKNIRKDCMFIADGLRPLVLQGQKKTVRETKPTSSIDKDILPYLPAICGLNTSYGAGYVDWFEQADDYSGDFFWCPPSIKAMGIYINTDLNHDYWLAPAGLNRGMVSATDVAFSPTSKQAGSIYEKCWNYAINYPQDGIVLEGQKTFQTKPTALDRVNVRRTMLRLERQVYKTVRYFVYENNTAYTRQRVVDAIEPIMKACWKSGNGGINRYKIVCDDKINDANTIDNNELKVQIGVVPNKSAEFILVDFVLGNQSSTWAELLG